MLFHDIDQHARQLTISLRDQQGDVLLARQVSTRPGKILQFFDQLTQRCAELNESFIAAVEFCGFNDWLICMLQNYRFPEHCRRLSDQSRLKLILSCLF